MNKVSLIISFGLNYSQIFEFPKSVFRSTSGRNVPWKMKWFIHQESVYKKSISILVKYPGIKIKKIKSVLLLAIYNLKSLLGIEISYLGQSIQEWPYFKFFKRCLPQILLGPFLNTLSHLIIVRVILINKFKKLKQEKIFPPKKNNCLGQFQGFMMLQHHAKK